MYKNENIYFCNLDKEPMERKDIPSPWPVRIDWWDDNK